MLANATPPPAIFRVATQLVREMCAAFPSAPSAKDRERTSGRSAQAWLDAKARMLCLPAAASAVFKGGAPAFRRLAWLWGSGAVEIANGTPGGRLDLGLDMGEQEEMLLAEISRLSAGAGDAAGKAAESGAALSTARRSTDNRAPLSAAAALDETESEVDDEALEAALRGIHQNLRKQLAVSRARDVSEMEAFGGTSRKAPSNAPRPSSELYHVVVQAATAAEEEYAASQENVVAETGQRGESTEFDHNDSQAAPPLPPRDADESTASEPEDDGILPGAQIPVVVAEPMEDADVATPRLVAAVVDDKTNDCRGAPGSPTEAVRRDIQRSPYFNRLVSVVCSESWSSPYEAQIEKDICRSQCTPDLQGSLGLVLRCYAARAPAVGYCQGMNFFAAKALCNNFTEEEAFWFLVAIVERVSPDKFTENLTGVHVDCEVVGRLLARYLPKLHQHMLAIEAARQPFLSGMLITLFSNQLASDCVAKLWDYCFLLGCRETVFAVVIDFFNGAGQLLLSASSSDAYNQFMVMQIEMWRSGAAAQADQIISRCMMWLVQMYQEPGLLEGLTLDSAAFVKAQDIKEKEQLAAREATSFNAVIRDLKLCSAFLGHRALTAATLPQRTALQRGCTALKETMARLRPDLVQTRNLNPALTPPQPQLGHSTEELVLLQIAQAFEKLLQTVRLDTSGIAAAQLGSSHQTFVGAVTKMASSARSLAQSGLPYVGMRAKLMDEFWATAVENVDVIDKKGFLDLDSASADGTPKKGLKSKLEKQLLTAFSTKEEFQQRAKEKTDALRKVLSSCMTVLLLAKMFSMELHYVSSKYFDDDTKFDSRTFVDDITTVVSAQLSTMLAGKREPFIEAYFSLLAPWRDGSCRLLLLGSEETPSASTGQNYSKPSKHAVSLLVLTRCLNLSEQILSQVHLLPRNLKIPFAEKLVNLFRGGIATAQQRIANARAVDQVLKNLENIKPWVAAVRKQQRLSKQQLLPVFNRTMWVQQQIMTLRDGKWRGMLLKQAQRFESDLREALIAAS